MDWLTGDDGSESDPIATDGLGFDDDLDDFDDDDMDDLGDADDGLGDLGDEMGGFDDGGMDDDGFGGPEIDPDTIAEMEDRISELENQVSSTTSEMSTVREENKQIGETVEELDETIRKLLDIYEMVTRGINPFVDDAREMGGLENEGAFGLFEMEEEAEEELDSDVADADAEAFFDEDFGDIDDKEAEVAAGDELTHEERESPAETLDDKGEDVTDDMDGFAEEGTDDDGDASGGGASFDDLKSEYEDGDGWDDVEGDEADDGDVEDDADHDDVPADAAIDADHDDAPADAAVDTDHDDAPADAAVDADHDDAPADEAAGAEESVSEAADEFVDPEPVDPEPAADAASDPQSNGIPDDAGATSPGASHPAAVTESEGPAETDAYLAEIPARYTAESVALEWARFLVDAGGVVGATRALRQYRDQGWITRRVERTVGEHVRNAAVVGGTEGTRDLRVRDHRESLTYISRLAGDVDDARLLEELAALGGGSRGIRG